MRAGDPEFYGPALLATTIAVMCAGDADEILLALRSTTEAVAIDEARFFDRTIIDVVNHLADEGRRVIVAGLATDFRGCPSGQWAT